MQQPVICADTRSKEMQFNQADCYWLILQLFSNEEWQAKVSPYLALVLKEVKRLNDFLLLPFEC